jgi:hypothetical protein
MILTDSRYATGFLYKAHDSRKNEYYLTVRRDTPNTTTDFVFYQWVEQDRLDKIAEEYLGMATHWWKIMDVNPEVINPFDIPVGTIIRIPIA